MIFGPGGHRVHRPYNTPSVSERQRPSRKNRPGPEARAGCMMSGKLSEELACDYAEIFLVAAAMLSRAAFKVLRDVAMFMRM